VDADRWRVPPALPAVKLGGAAALVLLALFVARHDRLGLTLAVAAALFLTVWGVRDLVAGVRLAADADGVTVVSGYAGRRRLPWAAIERIAVDTHTRRGLRSETLEVDTGEAIHLFSRWDLGAQPDEVAERLREIRR
jgi:hypothetical protein